VPVLKNGSISLANERSTIVHLGKLLKHFSVPTRA